MYIARRSIPKQGKSPELGEFVYLCLCVYDIQVTFGLYLPILSRADNAVFCWYAGDRVLL